MGYQGMTERSTDFQLSSVQTLRHSWARSLAHKDACCVWLVLSPILHEQVCGVEGLNYCIKSHVAMAFALVPCTVGAPLNRRFFSQKVQNS